VIQDLLIGVGIPILQIIAWEYVWQFTDSELFTRMHSEYAVSSNRYNIYEDFGPVFALVITPLTFVLFYAWPVVVGAVSLFYW
jgi:hypothetical protein